MGWRAWRDERPCPGIRPRADFGYADYGSGLYGGCDGCCFNRIAADCRAHVQRFYRQLSGRSAQPGCEIPVHVRRQGASAGDGPTMHGAGFRAAFQHSQSLYALFTSIPGLKVVVPSTPYDAKGLLFAAIEDNDPVIFLKIKRFTT